MATVAPPNPALGIFSTSAEAGRKAMVFGLVGAIGGLLGSILGEPLHAIMATFRSRGPAVDVVFVLDATASMQTQIDGVQRGIVDFARKLSERGLDERVALIAFRDETADEAPQVLSFTDGPFTEDYGAFQQAVAGVRAAGGGDVPESSYDAIRLAARQPFRPRATRVLLLITDAPPQLPDKASRSADDVRGELAQTGIGQLHLVVNGRDRQHYMPLQRDCPGEVFDLNTVAAGAGGFDGLLPVIGERIAEATVRGLASNTAIDAALAPWQMAITALWTGLLAAGVGLALVAGQNHYLHRPMLAPRQALTGLGLGLTVGAVAGGLGQLLGFLPQFLVRGGGEGSGAWVAMLFGLAGAVAGWAILGGLLGRGLVFFVPNLRPTAAMLGGVIGGLAGALGFTVLAAVFGDLAGRLLGAALLGFCIGVMIAIVEAVTRDFFLEVRYGQREVVNVSLGASPVTAGADGRASTIFVANAPRPVSLKYWIEDGQPRVLDYATERVTAAAVGDERKLGTVTLTVRSGSSGRGTPTAAAGGKAPPPPPAPPGTVGPVAKPVQKPPQPPARTVTPPAPAPPKPAGGERKLPPPPPPPAAPRKP